MNSIKFKKQKGITFFQKSILTMLKGTIISQIIGVIGTLLLAKIYGPKAYGIYGLFISISSFLALFNTLQLDNLIINAKDKEESKSMMNTALMTCIIVSITSTGIYLILNQFTPIIDVPFNVMILSLISGLIVSASIISINFLTVLNKFKTVSNLKITYTTLNITLQLILYVKFSFMGLIYGYITSTSSILLYYLYINRKYIKLPNRLEAKNNLKKDISIIKYYFPSTIINNIANNIIPTLFITCFSLIDYGVYALSIKILSIPLFIISSSVTPVYFDKASKLYLHTPKKLYAFTEKIIENNLYIGLSLIVLINTIGIYILELLFDKNWENIREITLILSFGILIKILYSPISDLVIILRKNKSNLYFNIYLLISGLLGIYFGQYYHSIIISISILSGLGGVGYALYLFYLMRSIKNL